MALKDLWRLITKKPTEKEIKEKKIGLTDEERLLQLEERRNEVELNRLKINELKRKRFKNELAQISKNIEDELVDEIEDYDEEDGEDLDLPQWLTPFIPMITSKLTGGKNQNDNSNPSPNTVHSPVSPSISDEEIRTFLKSTPKNYLSMAKASPKFLVYQKIKEKIPTLSNEDFERAYNILMTEFWKMKDDTILTLGLVAIGGYVAYRLVKPVEETLSDVGEGVGTAFEGAGESFSDVLTGSTSPFSYVDSYFDSKSQTQQAKQRLYTEAYTQEATKEIVSQEVQATQQTDLNKALTSQASSQKKYTLQDFTTKTTQEALNNSFNQEVQRKTEYGSTPTQFLKNTFMPTQEVAQERRENVLNVLTTAKNIVTTPAKKAVETVKTTAKNIISIFTRKK